MEPRVHPTDYDKRLTPDEAKDLLLLPFRTRCARTPPKDLNLKRFAFLCLFMICAFAAPASAAPGGYFIYVGSYASSGTGNIANVPSASEGIYAWRFNPASDRLAPLGLVAETMNPAYICATPNGRFLYAVNWQTATAAVTKCEERNATS